MRFTGLRWKPWTLVLAAMVSVLGALLLTAVPASTQEPRQIPSFDFENVGWIGIGNELEPPPNGPGPVTADPEHPYISNAEAARTGAAANFRVADLNNPILQPWVVDFLREQNEIALSGAATFDQKTRCWPPGVPSILLNPVLPIYLLQTPDEVWMLHEPNHDFRRIAINQPHSVNPTPLWYGDSVGHYEGDTLVVDTIGFNDVTDIDNYRTRHSVKLHMIERYRLINDGSILEASIYVEDEGAFTTPWSAIRRFRRVPNRRLIEVACAENNEQYFGFDVMPIPQDDTPDF